MEHKTKEYTIAAPILTTVEAMKKMRSIFAFGANLFQTNINDTKSIVPWRKPLR
jgi:hypothetical protein